MEKLRYRTPFKNRIVDNHLTEKHLLLRELEGTNYLVRTYHLPSDPKYLVEAVELHTQGIRRWERLALYGVELPIFSPIVGLREDGNPSLFLVTEKIKGPNLDEIPSIDPIIADNFMAGIIAYSRDVFQTRGEYLYDQNLSQYVYGEGHAGSKVYFVDLGSEARTLPQNPISDSRDNSYFFAGYLFRIFEMLEGLEKKSGETLISSRFALVDFLSHLPRNCTGISYARSLQREVMNPRLKGM